LLAIKLDLIAKCTLAIRRHPIAEHALAIFATSYRLNRNIELVAFIGLEGKNYVFSRVSLILVATFLFSVFAKSQLIFLCAFLGCTGIQFLFSFFCTFGTPS
jgi:hypothetical protein